MTVVTFRSSRKPDISGNTFEFLPLFQRIGETNYFYLSNFNAFLQVATASALEVMTIESINFIISFLASPFLSFKGVLIFPTLVNLNYSYSYMQFIAYDQI